MGFIPSVAEIFDNFSGRMYKTGRSVDVLAMCCVLVI